MNLFGIHQSSFTLLGWTQGQNGLFVDLCDTLEICRGLQQWRWRQLYWKEVEGDGQDRIPNGSKSTDGEILCQQRSSKSVVHMVLQNLLNDRQAGYNFLRIAVSGVSLGEQENCRPRVVERGVEWWLRVATRTATNGDDCWRQEGILCSSGGFRMSLAQC